MSKLYCKIREGAGTVEGYVPINNRPHVVVAYGDKLWAVEIYEIALISEAEYIALGGVVPLI